MLLRHKTNICEIEKSTYHSDEIFQMVVKNLTPVAIYNANAELFRGFVQTLVNYSPVSVNIIDYWNKGYGFNAALYKPPVKTKTQKSPKSVIQGCFAFEGDINIYDKGFANFAPYVIPPAGQPEGLDPYETTIPSLDENGNPILDESGNPKYIIVPHAGKFGLCSLYGDEFIPPEDCGFYLNSIIGLQDKLAEIFMHNVYSIAKKISNDHNFRAQMRDILSRVNLGNTEIFKSINNLFTEERFVINGDWIEKKGTEVAMRYAASQVYTSELQPKESQSHFKWETFSTDPMTYSIEGSIFPAMFEAFIKPLSHPIGYIYDYRMVCEQDFEEIVLGKKIEYAKSISVITLCSSNMEPCCNIFEIDGIEQPERPPYLNDPDETFECLEYSGEQYGRWFTIATETGYNLWGTGDYINNIAGSIDTSKPRSILRWEEEQRDLRNTLLTIENGISKDSNFYSWIYTKYIFTNLNYLIKYFKPQDINGATQTVIEYWRNGPEGFYCYARWNDGWQADINVEGYRYEYISNLSDADFSALTHKGRADVLDPYDGARWFGFNDDPLETIIDYPDLYDELVPADWEYYGIIPPGTNPSEDCNTYQPCDIKFPLKGFANFTESTIPPLGQVGGLDPLYLAGNLWSGASFNIRNC